MKFDDILRPFRALGGTADNVVLREGVRGRGLFAADPARPVHLHVPTRLLVSPRWIALDASEHITIAPQHRSSLGPGVATFFEHYQRWFGWGDGGLHAIRQQQRELQALPPQLKHYLEMLGGAEELKQKPTPAYCLQKYVANRQIRIRSESWLMPIAEMVNHDLDGLPYLLDQGVRLAGVVDGEVLARYHRHLDAFHFFIQYHFVTPADSVLSCEVTVEVPGAGTFHIARKDQLVGTTGALRMPQVTRKGAVTELSFVELANRRHPLQPRQTFTELLATLQVSVSVAHALFDGLEAHNRQVLTGLIHACQSHPGAMMARSLEQIASHQLAVMANGP